MNKRTRIAIKCLAMLTVALLPFNPVEAKKPPGPEGNRGHESPPYLTVDLLGLPAFTSGNLFYQSSALSINEPDQSGTVQVVGFALTGETGPPTGTNTNPTLWEIDAASDFAIYDLGLPPGAWEAAATDINNWGVITIDTAQGSDARPGWVSVPGLPLQELPFLGSNATPGAVNAFGEIVGTHANTDGALWFFDADGVVEGPIGLGKEGAGGFIPSDIADNGIMVGHVDFRPARAWFDVNEVLQVQRLDPSRGAFSGNALSISPDGNWVVGFVADGVTTQAFIWSQATGMFPLGLLGGNSSIANGVNNNGHVVGWSETSDPRIPEAAFLWREGQMFDLNNLTDASRKIQLLEATAINNVGQIVGEMHVTVNRTYELHAFALLPTMPKYDG